MSEAVEVPNAAAPRLDVGPSRSRARGRWRRYRQNRLAVVGLVFLVFVVLLALLAPRLSPFSPFAIVGDRLEPPGPKHLLGTDHLGRDILSGVLYGARTSLEVGFLSVGMAVAIGLVVGALSGYYGGWVDDLLMRITEVFQVLPQFFLALFIVAIFGANIWGIIFVIGVLSWAQIARLLRAEVLALKERPFVTAARAFGTGNLQLILMEILPNAVTPVIVAGSLHVAQAILLEASLSFLGVGDPNVVSWGTMLNNSQQYLRYAWWTATFPGLAMCIATLGVAFISDGLNDALNPRLKELGW